MLLWSIAGCVLLLAAAVLIARLSAATLGPYSMRLLGIGAACAGYLGGVSWLRFGQGSARPLRWHFLLYALPIAAAVGALYCLWRAVQNWRSELHGLVKTLLTLVLILVVGALAWFCLTR